MSSLWQYLFKAQGTTLAINSCYHPQSNGQREVLNKTLEMYLTILCFHGLNFGIIALGIKVLE